LPTLSRASVYNTVTALESAGLIRRLNIDGGEARYDAHMPDHGHFRCEACGAVRDFDTDLGALDLSALDGYTVGKRDLFVFGKCPDCQKK
jgi:Fe2+ or Zn2+ uptake regulation protein